MMNAIERQAVADFARTSLGCQCEPEVFRSISLEAGGTAGLPCVRVVVGERLLIWLVAGSSAEQRVAELARAGLRERDARGYNRFRLVLAEAGPDSEARFQSAVGMDGKAHLHGIPEADWPAPVRAQL
ncbi:hypothetical protein EZJ19_14700 [Parasulfuritortus cantonensis]|uniref:Uncharacterized protein n=1 Tax=Parasulfuritortus cantonensis TaxID=2528202 RepID=A0A4R1B0Z0_9PROT|nr:hypothetical protein [Parasulfuritortus cantonensis]TCJ11662.1 hypothetical protein EZJ19_14700 [Parasulfuritortus cantonensis]